VGGLATIDVAAHPDLLELMREADAFIC